MQSKAVSPGCNPRKSHVMRAEASMRRFSTSISFGLPVDPLVFTRTYGDGLFHSLINSSFVISFLTLRSNFKRPMAFTRTAGALTSRSDHQPPLLYSHLYIRQLDVISEELSCAQSLWHRDIRPIHFHCKSCDGIETDVALQRRGNP